MHPGCQLLSRWPPILEGLPRRDEGFVIWAGRNYGPPALQCFFWSDRHNSTSIAVTALHLKPSGRRRSGKSPRGYRRARADDAEQFTCTSGKGPRKNTRRGTPACITIFSITPFLIASIRARRRQVSIGNWKSPRKSSGSSSTSPSERTSTETSVSASRPTSPSIKGGSECRPGDCPCNVPPPLCARTAKDRGP
jgi:hypothetical protein